MDGLHENMVFGSEHRSLLDHPFDEGLRTTTIDDITIAGVVNFSTMNISAQDFEQAKAYAARSELSHEHYQALHDVVAGTPTEVRETALAMMVDYEIIEGLLIGKYRSFAEKAIKLDPSLQGKKEDLEMFRLPGQGFDKGYHRSSMMGCFYLNSLPQHVEDHFLPSLVKEGLAPEINEIKNLRKLQDIYRSALFKLIPRNETIREPPEVYNRSMAAVAEYRKDPSGLAKQLIPEIRKAVSRQYLIDA